MIKKILALIVITISFTNAQSSSAYTRYGIGDLKYSFSTRYQGLGQLGVSLQDKYHISTINPAAWSNFDRTKIEFALSYNGVIISGSNNKIFSAETEVEGVNFGFPISTDLGIGFAMGLIPFSRVSYQSRQNFSNADSLIYNYDLIFEGKGGLSKIFLGSSVKTPFDWSVGATFDYYFGNFKYLSAISFNNQTNFASEYNLVYRPTGFGATFGILSPDLNNYLGIENLSNLNLGASVNYFSKFKTDSVVTSISSVLLDTIALYSDYLELPTKFNVGLSFVLNQRYLFTFDYSSQNFSDFKLFSKTSDNLQNSFKVSTGFELQPINELSSKFWERVLWRVGLSFEKTPYKFSGIGINQYSFFGGLSMPINPDNLIDISMQYSMRGTNEKNLLKEDFIRLNLSLVFNELWFLRFDK
jgi:hypothetical protein